MAGSTLSVAESHLYRTTIFLALSAVCMLVSSAGAILFGTGFFEGSPRNYAVMLALVAGGRVGTSFAQVRALDPGPSLVRWHSSVLESLPEPGGSRALVPRIRPPRSRSSASSMASGTTLRTPRSASDDLPEEKDLHGRVRRNTLSRGNLETHNYWLDAGLPIAHGKAVPDAPAKAAALEPPQQQQQHDRQDQEQERSPAGLGESSMTSSSDGANDNQLIVVKVRVRPSEFEQISLAVTSGSTIGELRESVRQCALMQQRQLHVVALEDHAGHTLDGNMRVGRAVRAAEGEQEGVLTGRWGLNPLK